MKRIYLALWPDSKTASQIERAAAQLPWSSSCRREVAGDLHLTLHYIGFVPDEQIPFLTKQLKVPFEPFTLKLGSLEKWPGDLFVLTPLSIPPALAKLHAALGLVLQQQKLPVSSRKFQPHVTLARRGRDLEVKGTIEPVLWRVDDYALVLSTGDPLSRYEVLCRYLS